MIIIIIIPIPLPKEFYKLPTAPVSSAKMFYVTGAPSLVPGLLHWKLLTILVIRRRNIIFVL